MKDDSEKLRGTCLIIIISVVRSNIHRVLYVLPIGFTSLYRTSIRMELMSVIKSITISPSKIIHILQLSRQPSSATQPNSLSIHVGTVDNPVHGLSEFIRLAESSWIHNALILETPPRFDRKVGGHAAVEHTWSDGNDADVMAREITRHGECHRNESTLGGRIGCLSWLTFELSV